MLPPRWSGDFAVGDVEEQVPPLFFSHIYAVAVTVRGRLAHIPSGRVNLHCFCLESNATRPYRVTPYCLLREAIKIRTSLRVKVWLTLGGEGLRTVPGRTVPKENVGSE